MCLVMPGARALGARGGRCRRRCASGSPSRAPRRWRCRWRPARLRGERGPAGVRAEQELTGGASARAWSSSAWGGRAAISRVSASNARKFLQAKAGVPAVVLDRLFAPCATPPMKRPRPSRRARTRCPTTARGARRLPRAARPAAGAADRGAGVACRSRRTCRGRWCSTARRSSTSTRSASSGWRWGYRARQRVDVHRRAHGCASARGGGGARRDVRPPAAGQRQRQHERPCHLGDRQAHGRRALRHRGPVHGGDQHHDHVRHQDGATPARRAHRHRGALGRRPARAGDAVGTLESSRAARPRASPSSGPPTSRASPSTRAAQARAQGTDGAGGARPADRGPSVWPRRCCSAT